jgi:hypothetical protein
MGFLPLQQVVTMMMMMMMLVLVLVWAVNLDEERSEDGDGGSRRDDKSTSNEQLYPRIECGVNKCLHSPHESESHSFHCRDRERGEG